MSIKDFFNYFLKLKDNTLYSTLRYKGLIQMLNAEFMERFTQLLKDKQIFELDFGHFQDLIKSI